MAGAPAPCHPSRPMYARGLCKGCWERDRRNDESFRDALWAAHEEDWHKRADCRRRIGEEVSYRTTRAAHTVTISPDTWFPAHGDKVMLAIAKKVCRECPVRAACAAYALTHEEKEGIWGGLTGKERGRLRNRSAA